MRSHGMSGGKYFTYGLRESVDLEPWFEFTRKRLGDNCRIYMCPWNRSYGGASGGAAAELLSECLRNHSGFTGFSDRSVAFGRCRRISYAP